MSIKTLKSFFARLLALVVRGLARWFVLLGEHPGLSRDAGFLAWRHLQQLGRAGSKDAPDPELPAGEVAPPPASSAPAQGIEAQLDTSVARVHSQLPPSVRRALKRRRRQAGSAFLGL